MNNHVLLNILQRRPVRSLLSFYLAMHFFLPILRVWVWVWGWLYVWLIDLSSIARIPTHPRVCLWVIDGCVAREKDYRKMFNRVYFNWAFMIRFLKESSYCGRITLIAAVVHFRVRTYRASQSRLTGENVAQIKSYRTDIIRASACFLCSSTSAANARVIDRNLGKVVCELTLPKVGQGVTGPMSKWSLDHGLSFLCQFNRIASKKSDAQNCALMRPRPVLQCMNY